MVSALHAVSRNTMTLPCALMQMCAPYNALQNYKLKVKMTPGSQRKGRAARQVCAAVFSVIVPVARLLHSKLETMKEGHGRVYQHPYQK
jgi:hypothetical protein